MPATLTALIARTFGSSLLTAFQECGTAGVGPQNLDLIQIVNAGNNAGNSVSPTVDVNVDHTGVVHNPALNPTNGTRLGVFFAINTPNGSTTAQFFAGAFTNPSQQDIVQNVNEGGNVTYYLSYLGVATGS